jgi:pilus assembly protein FimV
LEVELLTPALHIALLGLALAAPAPVLGVELGKLTVDSVQGQPLRAQIEIDARPHERADSITAALAPIALYGGMGLAYSPALDGVRVSVERRPDGRQVISLAGQHPVNRPYVDMVVQLETSKGRVRRAYTFLLEPGRLAGALSVTPPVARTVAQARASSVAQPGVPRKHRVGAGETLRGLARMYRPDGVTLSQMMVAIFRANQDAFLAQNINRLRRGSTLAIPDADIAAATSADEARRMVRSQHARSQVRHASSAEPRETASQAPAGDALSASRSDGTGQSGDQTQQAREVEEVNARAMPPEKDRSATRQLVEPRNARIARLEEQDAVGAGTKARAFSISGGPQGGSTAFAEFRRKYPCPAPGAHEPCIGYVIAYVVPICAGGEDAANNLQWFTVEAALRKERADQTRCAPTATTQR